jgi:hypothetical protein
VAEGAAKAQRAGGEIEKTLQQPNKDQHEKTEQTEIFSLFAPFAPVQKISFSNFQRLTEPP